MGLFGSSKVKRIINRANADLERQARAKGGCCRNCKEYDAFRGVCTGPVTMAGKQPGHITTPDSICPHWKI